MKLHSRRAERAPDRAVIKNPGSDRDAPFLCSLVLSKSARGTDKKHLWQRTDSLQMLVTI